MHRQTRLRLFQYYWIQHSTVDANARGVNGPHKRASHEPGRKDITVRLRNKRATPLNKVSKHKQDATPKPNFLVNQASIAHNNGIADDAGPHRIQCHWLMCIWLQ